MTVAGRMMFDAGTRIEIGPYWAVTHLPGGRRLDAHPNLDSPGMARELGFGGDVAAMTRSHDALHAIVSGLCGQPFSHSLMLAASGDADPELAALEEAAVLSLQRYWRAVLSDPVQRTLPAA